jgi:hypothetical protein
VFETGVRYLWPGTGVHCASSHASFLPQVPGLFSPLDLDETPRCQGRHLVWTAEGPRGASQVQGSEVSVRQTLISRTKRQEGGGWINPSSCLPPRASPKPTVSLCGLWVHLLSRQLLSSQLVVRCGRCCGMQSSMASDPPASLFGHCHCSGTPPT